LFELLLREADRDPAAPAVLFGATRVTYSDLLESSRRIAAELTRRDVRRFCIVDPDPSAVLPLLAAASRVGAEACIYPPTATRDAVGELLERFDHAFLVTSRDDLGGLCEVVTAAELQKKPTDLIDNELPPERPHLVLTTGTTGKPRGVRHDWSRLARIVDGAVPGAGAGERWLLAYGMNQFGGLQVLLHVVGTGATLVATETFQPKAGLDALRGHDVTHASATPTFWRFLLAELGADGGPVPSLQQITLGGEAPSEQVLDALKRTFPNARITQIYAANEFGKARSVRDATSGLPLSALDDDDDVQLKVKDGELWVRSGVGMLGYYGEDPIDPDGWRPTGDLVEIVDERVFFRGRTSDVINVGGVKVHPLPVEDRISEVPGVQMARVFGRPNALTGAIVAVEVIAEPGQDTEAIDAAIRAACADMPPASRPRSIRFVDEISTTGHKIIRQSTEETP
jgi:acyl-CoA synthetase (AMP-forming)/AMP-acid ligase II